MCSENFLTAETQSGLMDIYVASPETESKVPVILVFQEAFGVNSHIRKICDRLAKVGFLAAAPELFHRAGRRIEISYAERQKIMPLLGQMTNEEIIQDAQDTLHFLKDLPNADLSHISTIGFCVGGFASALCATRLDVKRMISFYGAGMVKKRDGIGLEPILDEMDRIQGSCLFFYGGKDASIPRGEINLIEKKLTAAEVPFEVDVFENSDHGFFCDQRKSYNQGDASIAWKKTLKFLAQ